MANYRNVIKWLVPAWLNRNDGEKVLQSVAILVDVFAERVRLGLEARLPTRAGTSALILLGRDRGIARGRTENEAHYAARLVRWRYPRGHRTRGSAFALLEQISEYFGGAPCYTIDMNGTRFDRALDGTESASYGNAWTWDSSTDRARFWVVVDGSGFSGEHPDFGDPALWGGALGTAGYSVGQMGIASEDALAVRRLLSGRPSWKPAGTRGEWLVFAPTGGEPSPDLTWEHWSTNVAGTQTASRDPSLRYWSFVPTVNNVYGGDPENYPTDSYMPDGTLYAGSGASFPASSTLPDGATYAGDGSSFPASVQLLDDGDLPQ